MKILSNKFYFLIVALFMFINTVTAQPEPPPPEELPDPPVVPIDGLLTVFIVVAVVFGIYIIHRKLINQTPSGN
jgi:hypothetical protein